MVEHLPPDSAAHRARMGHSWTRDSDWHVADIRDLLQALYVLTYNINRGKDAPAAEYPKPVPRPKKLGVEATPDDESEQASRARIHAQIFPTEQEGQVTDDQ